MKVGVFVGKQSKPIVLLDFNSGPILFFAFNTKLPNMSYGNSKDFIAAKKVTTSGARSDGHWIKSLIHIQLC